MTMNRMTTEQDWDEYWDELLLPSEIKRANNSLFLNEILNIIELYFPPDRRLSIMEIGGSPGQYLAYMHKQFGYEIHCLDYSEIGCAKTKENLEMLNISGKVYRNDFFSNNLNLPQFDIVYSLGLAEHFLDLDSVIENHLKLLKPNGLLLIGSPNFLGINHWFLKRLVPDLLSKHNLNAMDIANWASFEDKFNLEILFKGYVGGFEPQNFNRWEKKTAANFILKVTAKVLTFLFHNHIKFLRKFNSKYFSGYILGIYRKHT